MFPVPQLGAEAAVQEPLIGGKLKAGPQLETTGFEALVFFGRLVIAPVDLPPLMTRLFSYSCWLCTGWLFWMVGCGVLRRPSLGGRNHAGLIASAFLVGGLPMGLPFVGGAFTSGTFFPLVGIGFLIVSVDVGREVGSDSYTERNGLQLRSSGLLQWAAVSPSRPSVVGSGEIPAALDNGLVFTMGIHLVFAAGEACLPRNLIDPWFLSLAGFAASFLAERIALAFAAPTALVLAGRSWASRLRRTVAVVLSVLVLGTILGGGAFAGWTFGRVYVASLIELAITAGGLVGAVVVVWRREVRRAVALQRAG